MFLIPPWVTVPAKLVWSGIRKVPGELWIYLFVVLAALFYGEVKYGAGQRAERLAWESKLEPVKKSADNLARAVAPVATAVTADVQKKTADVRYVTNTIIKKVPIYVPVDTPDLPAGFRRLHDAAAEGRDPGAPEYAAAEAVSAQDVASTVADNYGTCHEYAVKLNGWIDWWSGVEAACKATEGCTIIPPATGAGKD